MYSPTYFRELRLQLAYLVKEGQGLCAVRYPRGKELFKPGDFHSGTEPTSVYGEGETALVTYGRLFSFAAGVPRSLLQARGISVKLIKLNRIIPLDPRAVEEALPCRHVLSSRRG